MADDPYGIAGFSDDLVERCLEAATPCREPIPEFPVEGFDAASEDEGDDDSSQIASNRQSLQLCLRNSFKTFLKSRRKAGYTVPIPEELQERVLYITLASLEGLVGERESNYRGSLNEVMRLVLPEELLGLIVERPAPTPRMAYLNRLRRLAVGIMASHPESIPMTLTFTP